jgi:serine/threonine-protein kinase RsbW
MATLSFAGRYDNLALISEFVRQYAEQAGMDPMAVYEIETAVDEACTNIIDYAYCGEGKGEIEVTCDFNDQELTIILKDCGKPFNPDKIPKPKLNAPLSKRQAHGLGLYIMHQWMDEVHFEFTKECGNILTMVKRKEKKPC